MHMIANTFFGMFFRQVHVNDECYWVMCGREITGLKGQSQRSPKNQNYVWEQTAVYMTAKWAWSKWGIWLWSMSHDFWPMAWQQLAVVHHMTLLMASMSCAKSYCTIDYGVMSYQQYTLNCDQTDAHFVTSVISTFCPKAQQVGGYRYTLKS